VKEVSSPLQCAAGDYGSSFSRAAELVGPTFRRVFVSGTASIDPQGRTAHPGDVEAQIGLTFEGVGAILESRGMGFGDVVRGNAYFKDAADALALGPALQEHGLDQTRLLVSRNTVCRGDLLFEMEVDAVRGKERG
jgi:enamine deaminase RidA (YjgF/YER057c/UK114 family)